MPGAEGAQLLDQLAQLLQQLGQLGYDPSTIQQMGAGLAQLQDQNAAASTDQNPITPDVAAAGAPAAGGDMGAAGAAPSPEPQPMGGGFGGAAQAALADYQKQGHFGRGGSKSAHASTTAAQKRKKGSKA